MAKLYWRIKKQGKWTWKPAKCDHCLESKLEWVCGDCCIQNTASEETVE